MAAIAREIKPGYHAAMSTAAVLTISDTRSDGTAEDLSGPAAEEMLADAGIEVTHRDIVPDDDDAIHAKVQSLVDQVSLIVTTGGTGIAIRDVTPEAVAPLIDKPLPGFGEIMRTGSFSKTPLSIISRGGAGIAGRTLIVMLPGSPRGVRDGLGLLGPAIRHVLQFLAGGPVRCEPGPMPDA
ncbi:MAG: molybdenum cofactor biosynthesis protein B [Phycisphaerae bacterium]